MASHTEHVRACVCVDVCVVCIIKSFANKDNSISSFPIKEISFVPRFFNHEGVLGFFFCLLR